MYKQYLDIPPKSASGLLGDLETTFMSLQILNVVLNIQRIVWGQSLIWSQITVTFNNWSFYTRVTIGN